MSYKGDFRTGTTVRHMWVTNATDGSSITRATNGTVSVYKDNNLTQSTDGVTDTEDFDSVTGVHYCGINTAANATFYSAGSDFHVVLSGAVIDGKSVNAVLFSFSLENRSAIMPTVTGRTLDVSAGGEAGVDWSNVGSPSSSVTLSGTTVGTATTVTNQLSAATIADGLLDRAAGVETGLTPRQFFRLAASALFGKASGLATTTAVYRDFGDSKNRISATVDSSGNRSAVTTDAT